MVSEDGESGDEDHGDLFLKRPGYNLVVVKKLQYPTVILKTSEPILLERIIPHVIWQ